MVQKRFYPYVNNSVGPSIQQEMFALDLRSFSSDSTHHQFHHKAPVCFGVGTARCRNAVSSCCISQLASSSSRCLSYAPWRGDGEEGVTAGQRAQGAASHPRCLPTWKGVSQIGHSLKLYIAEFRKPPLTRTIANGKKKKQHSRFLLSLLGRHNHQDEDKAQVKRYLSDTP